MGPLPIIKIDCIDVSLGIMKSMCANIFYLIKKEGGLIFKLLTKKCDFLTEQSKKKVLQKQHLKYIETND